MGWKQIRYDVTDQRHRHKARSLECRLESRLLGYIGKHYITLHLHANAPPCPLSGATANRSLASIGDRCFAHVVLGFRG